MKFRLMSGAIAAALLISSVTAQANWRFTSWGMSVDQVVAAGKAAKVQAIADVKDDRVGDLQRLAVGETRDAGIDVQVQFYFTSGTKRLAMIRYQSIAEMDCADVETAAVRQFGAGKVSDKDAQIDTGKGETLTYTEHSRDWTGPGGDTMGFMHAMYKGRSLTVCTWVFQAS